MKLYAYGAFFTLGMMYKDGIWLPIVGALVWPVTFGIALRVVLDSF